MRQMADSNKKHIVYGVLTLVSTFIIVMSCWRLWGTDIKVPLTGYRHDSVGVLMEASNYVRGGSLHVRLNSGAPYAGEYVSGGFGDSSVPIPLIALIAKVTGSVEAGINIHAILNILLLAISTFWVCIKLKISDVFSMISAVAYANMSFFLMYGNTLLMIYSACFYIPLFCYVVIDLMLSKDEDIEEYFSWKRIIFTMAVMLYVGINSAYYAFFTLIILAFVMLHALFASKRADKVIMIVLSYISIGSGIMVYTLPSILHKMGFTDFVVAMRAKLFVWLLLIAIIMLAIICFIAKKTVPHITIKTVYIILGIMVIVAGAAYIVIRKYTNFLGTYDGRSWLAVEMGALRLINMISPAPNNTVTSANNIVETWVDVAQGDYTVLGILSGIGFIYSILKIFSYKENITIKDEVIKICGLLNVFISVVAVKGGFASLIAMFVTTGIRNYNRMCIFIALFSLISVGILCDKVLEKAKSIQKPLFKNVSFVAVYGITLLALIMSIPSYFIYTTSKGPQYGLVDYEQRKAEYDEWQRYMTAIESSVSEDAMILQLPLSIDGTYVGVLMEERGQAYELDVPAILSKTTCWSTAGGIKSKKWKQLVNNVNSVEDILMAAGIYDFEGIYVDTLMYHDESYIELLGELEEYLGKPMVCSENRRYFFWMKDFNEQLHEKYTDEQLIDMKNKIEKHM